MVSQYQYNQWRKQHRKDYPIEDPVFLFKTNKQINSAIMVGFSNRQEKHIDINFDSLEHYEKFEPIYIPPKEMISTTEHFQSLYEDYHLDFEETYYDLTKLLDKPLKKGANTTEQMGLVSEGYRKLATIIYLISSGSLDKNSILFWDEPETNMNPKMIRPVTEAIIELAKMGGQVFIATHDYFVQQSFNLMASYPKYNKYNLDIQFLSLFYDEGRHLRYEIAGELLKLTRNAIMEEFDLLYEREQEILYEN